MVQKKLKRLSDFEWASGGRYIQYVSSVARLLEINSNHIISFPLGRLGVDKLLKQKVAARKAVESNLRSIERFAAEHKGELDDNEMAILRGIYSQYKVSLETVSGHITFLETCRLEDQLSALKRKEDSEDEELF